MPAFNERFRHSARLSTFRMTLSKSAILALDHYASADGLPEDRSQRIACVKLEQFGLLDSTGLADDSASRDYEITAIGMAFHNVLRQAYMIDRPYVPPGETPTCFVRFRELSRGESFGISLSRTSIGVIRYHYESPTQHVRSRRQGEYCRRLAWIGLLDPLPEFDCYGRELFEITAIGQVFYDLLVISGHIPGGQEPPPRSRRPRRRPR